ncbi:hydantoinase/oxoprolinase family protein [Amycolatopsis pithecellobii]|uniref:Hydantoinase/oxoprolinase family protein n=1 Tax=Amycolatopsis pithecellobii TaxID=664692 RepID=A0A6N7YZZ1_9PSEU|nr:hydantoinase/oxoprolinase family protein [Amycolatopsis pithecellobii]MTD53061.1 hydantoinase/oxoprolinase family protein [Amycolatopsis pithecellobii]
MTRKDSIRIGVDIGGTFTDVVLSAGGALVFTAKVMTTYGDLLEAIRAGIDRCLAALPGPGPDLPSDVSTRLIHGTTLVSNAYVTRDGAEVSLVTTDGFRDVLDFPQLQRFDIWDLDIEYLPPLVDKQNIHEVAERTDFQGAEIAALDHDAIKKIAPRLTETVAVSLLNSHMNPAHEREVRDALLALRPELEVSLSSDTSREAGEYYRTITAVANAFVKPVMKQYLARLEDETHARLGADSRFMMMLSDGGLCSARTAQDLPVRIVESGPAAGVTAAHAFIGSSDFLREAGAPVVALDMGGTTAKIVFIEPHAPIELSHTIEVARDELHRTGSGMSLLVPSVDLVEIGAGGSSIARRNELGLIEVGPESASSEPGPAVYGRGGTLPTVTDANVVLGYLPPWQRLGGVSDIHPELARTAVAGLASGAPDGDGAVEEVALGIHRIANEKMAGAVRVAAADRGRRVEEHVLLASGGAAPIHACGIASQVGIKRVIIPPEPGVFSAVGLVWAPEKFETVRSLKLRLPWAATEYQQVQEAFEDMKAEIATVMESGDVEVTARADLRFARQHHVLTVNLGPEIPPADEVVRTFRKEYVRLYNRCPDAATEMVNLRVEGLGRTPDIRLDTSHIPAGSDQPRTTRATFVHSGPSTIPAYQRVGETAHGSGPALITENHTTTVVPPGWNWQRLDEGTLILEAVAPHA